MQDLWSRVLATDADQLHVCENGICLVHGSCILGRVADVRHITRHQRGTVGAWERLRGRCERWEGRQLRRGTTEDFGVEEWMMMMMLLMITVMKIYITIIGDDTNQC
mmetsp:Transcript_38108/g.45977  ORF Transcript_38108/g.45977 Transcript_38108/m.45977 type:complete len:107 (-) Transcript_38108:853-1173(-)